MIDFIDHIDVEVVSDKIVEDIFFVDFVFGQLNQHAEQPILVEVFHTIPIVTDN